MVGQNDRGGEGNGVVVGSRAPGLSDQGLASLTGATRIVTVLALAMATFMQVLDLTIANVSLPTIAGSLGVSPDTSTWIITTFTIANGMAVPLTGWLMARYGVVRVFILSLLTFTLASFLCGIAWNLQTLLLFRAIQGLGSGPMVPGAQALMILSFPPERRASAIGISSTMVLIGPIAGPLLGGYISDNFNWSWIFLINVPVGLVIGLVVWPALGHRDTPTRKLPIDSVGLALLVVWVGTLQTMLDLGKNADWFASTTIVVLAAVSLVVFLIWLIWELTEAHPIVELSLFRERNFLFGTIAICLGFGVFFSNVLLLPLWLQTQLGYTATWAGLSVAPHGITAIMLAPFVTKLMHRIDNRWIASVAMLALATAYYLRASYTADVSFGWLVAVSFIQGLGAGSFFQALTTIILDGLPPAQIPSAIGLSNFARIVAAAFATSLTTTLWDRREAFHQSHLVEAATPAAGSFVHTAGQLASLGMQGRAADAVIHNQLVNQAYLLSTVDLYSAFSLITAILALLVWTMRRSGPAKR
jgi:DHA2 family multidrug resistance protein